MDLVPDTGEFNKLMMLVIAEVADNTSHVGMREYPSQLAASLGGAAKAAQPSGARFSKSSTQHKVLSSGLTAMERCATKYLETGGGRFESAQSVAQRSVPKKRPSRKRARGPGKALNVLLNDFVLYDDKQRSDVRHLPSASGHGVALPKDHKDPRYACGVLRKLDRVPGSVSSEKTEMMRHTMRKLFKYAKRVGADIAKSVPPQVDYSFKRSATTKELAATLNSVLHSKSSGAASSKRHHQAGILQNLNQAMHLLSVQRQTFKEASSLIAFLEDAIARILKLTQKFCVAKVGADKCTIEKPLEAARLPIQHSRLPSESKKTLANQARDYKNLGNRLHPDVTHLTHEPLPSGHLAKNLKEILGRKDSNRSDGNGRSESSESSKSSESSRSSKSNETSLKKAKLPLKLFTNVHKGKDQKKKTSSSGESEDGNSSQSSERPRNEKKHPQKLFTKLLGGKDKNKKSSASSSTSSEAPEPKPKTGKEPAKEEKRTPISKWPSFGKESLRSLHVPL
jgi:hypothetical protein